MNWRWLDLGYIQDQIVTFVREYVNAMNDKLKYDRTEFGKVVSYDDKEAIVTINGENSVCKIKDGMNISVEDVVIVKVPNNNVSKKYIDGKFKK